MLAAEGAFTALADVLWPARVEPGDTPPLNRAGELDGMSARDGASNLADAAPVAATSAPGPWDDIARDVRLFRARLHDAFDAAVDGLLRDVAYAVLGRELLLTESDVAAIAERVLAEHRDARPLRVRVAPSDVASVVTRASGLPEVVADATLAPGDAVVEFTDVAIDARFGTRLAALLDDLA